MAGIYPNLNAPSRMILDDWIIFTYQVQRRTGNDSVKNKKKY